jgi:hypothetical protein
MNIIHTHGCTCFDISVYKECLKHTNVNLDTTSLLEENLKKCQNMSERKWMLVIFTICLHLIYLLWFIWHAQSVVQYEIILKKYINRFIVSKLWCALSLCEMYLICMNWLFSICNPHGNSVNTVLIYFSVLLRTER